MRQYGEVPPWLSTARPPAVTLAIGLGTGGGAGVQTPDGSGFGTVRVRTGSNPSGIGGSISFKFPDGNPPPLFVSCSEGFGAVSVNGNDGSTDTVQVLWGAALPANSDLRIHYEWATSK